MGTLGLKLRSRRLYGEDRFIGQKYGNRTVVSHEGVRGTLGNVWLVTADINFAKQQLSVEAFVALCRSVAVHADAVTA